MFFLAYGPWKCLEFVPRTALKKFLVPTAETTLSTLDGRCPFQSSPWATRCFCRELRHKIEVQHAWRIEDRKHWKRCHCWERERAIETKTGIFFAVENVIIELRWIGMWKIYYVVHELSITKNRTQIGHPDSFMCNPCTSSDTCLTLDSFITLLQVCNWKEQHLPTYAATPEAGDKFKVCRPA